MPFSLISKTIKKTKHIFAADYPDFSKNEYEELIKLTKEANTIFQVTNPLYNHPGIKWLKNNIQPPAYLDISYFIKNLNTREEPLINILMMLQGVINTSLKKILALSFKNVLNNSDFNNIRLDFGNAIIANINLGKQPSYEFTIQAYSSDKVIYFNIPGNNFRYNYSNLDLKKIKYSDEFDIFLENILSKKQQVTEIEDYLKVMQNFMLIKSKLSQYSDT